MPGDLPGVISVLPGMELVPCGPHFSITRGTEKEITVETLEYMESYAHGYSAKGSRLEAPQFGATGWDPAEQGTGESPLTGGTTDAQESKLGEPGER